MKTQCERLGIKLCSGHVRVDEHWEQTMQQALRSGQQYLICSSLQSREPTLDNFKRKYPLGSTWR